MLAQGEFRLSTIGQIAVPARDLARGVEFYRDRLGLPLLFQVPGMAFFDAGGIRLMLGLPENEQSARASSIIYYRVDDIGGAHAALAARGVQFVEAPRLIARLPTHELWMAFFKDTEDNVLALMSEVKPAP